MRRLIILLSLLAGAIRIMVLSTMQARAVVCARGVARAGCVGPAGGAVVVRRPAVAPRGAVVIRR